MANGTTVGVVFPLSDSEMNRYINSDNVTRIVYDVSGTAQIWWLRSSTSASSNASLFDPNIGIVAARCTHKFALRPAMWIDTTP